MTKEYGNGVRDIFDYLQPASPPFDTELAAIDYIESKKKHHPEQIFTIIKVY